MKWYDDANRIQRWWLYCLAAIAVAEWLELIL